MIGHRQQRLRKSLTIRARVIQAVRQFFVEHDYLEIETPIRIPAPAPEAHIDAVAAGDWFLQTSPELCMKQLLASGYPRIFQICKCFRQAERGRLHLPEMTLLEWYRAGSNYQDMMNECEALICSVAQKMGKKKDGIVYQGEEIRLNPPWSRISVGDAFDRFGSISLEGALASDQFDDIMVTEIEPALGKSRPVFLYDYPACRGTLARLKPQDRRYAERFELYIGGLEICNAYSELADPAEQRIRFEQAQKRRRESGKPVYPMPHKFLDALNDMPEASGNALGMDRLAMLFADASRIEDVVAFVPEEL
jgi:lysyl-tRNA synthetase class 2